MEKQERRRRTVATLIAGTARAGKYLLLLLTLYVASFGPVRAVSEFALWSPLTGSLAVVYTPLAESATALHADQRLVDYANLCEQAIRLLGLTELETPYRAQGGVI